MLSAIPTDRPGSPGPLRLILGLGCAPGSKVRAPVPPDVLMLAHPKGSYCTAHGRSRVHRGTSGAGASWRQVRPMSTKEEVWSRRVPGAVPSVSLIFYEEQIG